MIVEKLDTSFIKSSTNYEKYDCEKLIEICKLLKLIISEYSGYLTYLQKDKIYNFVQIIVEYFEENESNNSFTNTQVLKNVQQFKNLFS